MKLLVKILNTLFISILLLFSACFGGESSVDEDYHPGVRVLPPANLEISGDSSRGAIDAGSDYDFGDRLIEDTSETIFIVRNRGERKATQISASSLEGPFAFKGGAYPGRGGTCTSSLFGEDSCTIVVEFTPSSLASFSTDLVLTYNNGKQENAIRSISKKLSGNGYSVSPLFTSITPASGVIGGGTTVTITGRYFRTGMVVTLGGNPCSDVEVAANKISLTCITSAHAAGSVDLVVSNDLEQSVTSSAIFAYVYPPPTVTSISPTTGTMAGSTAITVTGTGFLAGATVLIGGNACTAVTVNSDTSISCTTPAHAIGAVSVIVTNTDTQTGTGTNVFTYYDATAPTAAAFGSTTSIGYTGFTLNWNAASDNLTTVNNLQYLVCTAAAAATVSTINGCLGATIAMNWTANTTALIVTGKTHSTDYYYNVLVKDDASNYALYGGITQRTLNAFISSWKTDNVGTSTNTQITLPLEASGTYNFTVDWGDSTTNTITAWNDAATTHTYSATGTYTVAITGTITGFRFNNGADKLKIMNISQWGPLRLGNNNAYFWGAINLTITATDILDLTGTTNLSYAFKNCKALTTVPNMNSWNTANVTNMSNMFYGADLFNQNIGSWNTANVTDMSQMFVAAYAFNQDIGGWNTANVTSMSGMFWATTSFNQNIGNWNTANVTDMSAMFQFNTVFNQNIGSWNTAKVTTFATMFFRASAFNQDIGSWNTAAATSISSMFYEATAFDQYIGNWNTANVQIMYNVFRRTTYNRDISNWNTANVLYMADMFEGNTSFNQNIGSWNTSKVTDMSGMFKGATAFNQNIGSWDTSKVYTMSGMFDGATAFNQNIGGWDTSTVIVMREMFRNATAFNQNIGNWNTANVTNMGNMFQNATSFNQNIGNWNTIKVRFTWDMFNGATAFNQNIGSWNMAEVISMAYMFAGATNFNQNIGAWNTANVTAMNNMFQHATSFNQNIGGWNTTKVTTMLSMFDTATAFNQNIGGWDTANVTRMDSMFYAAAAFNQNLSAWNIAKVTNMTSMFAGVTLSTANYDALLIGWDAQVLKPNINFHGGNSKYSFGTAAETARSHMISSDSWTFTDGGGI